VKRSMFASTFSPRSSPSTDHRVALHGVHSNGNLEWWSYQQAFLPPLYFSRPRVNRATLGVGKSVPVIPFGANALVLGPSSWGFGAPNAIPISVEWPMAVRPGRPNW
jgi:hypothetical protein